MRLVPSFHLSFPDVRAMRIALASGAVAGLVVTAACTDSSGSKAITAPSGVRNATIGSGGFGQAQSLTLCVDASSPAGTYTFRNIALNRSFAQDGFNNALSGNGFWDGTFWNDPGDGGDGTTVANKFVNVDYPLTPGNCVLVLNRTAPNSNFATANKDSYAAANISYISNTGGAVYDHTDCLLDDGVYVPEHINPTTGNPPVAIQPWPQATFDHNNPPAYTCGSSNSITRGFVNFEHGATITYVFTEGTTGIIAPTATTCAQYNNGTASTLGEIDVGFSGGGTINSASPGVFFYFAKLTKAASQLVGFEQSFITNPAVLPLYDVHQTQAYLYNTSCTTVATLTVDASGKFASGGFSLPAGNYILGVKFNTQAVKGVSVSPGLRVSGSLLATNKFEAWLGTIASLLASTTATVDTKAK